MSRPRRTHSTMRSERFFTAKASSSSETMFRIVFGDRFRLAAISGLERPSQTSRSTSRCVCESLSVIGSAAIRTRGRGDRIP